MFGAVFTTYRTNEMILVTCVVGAGPIVGICGRLSAIGAVCITPGACVLSLAPWLLCAGAAYGVRVRVGVSSLSCVDAAGH